MAARDNTARAVSDDQEIDLADLLNILLQGWKLILLVFVVVLGFGLAYAVLAPPVYQADALIQVEDQKGSVAGLSQLSDTLGIQSSVVTGELEILRSREVLLNAINATHATTQVDVDNRFPIIGHWMARRFSPENENQLAEPFFGLSSYAWGGEEIELGELELPRAAFGDDFYLTITNDGFQLADADGRVMLSDSRLGHRLLFKVSGQDASISIKNLKGSLGTRFRINKTSPVVMASNLRSQLSVSEAGKQSQIIKVVYENTDRQFAKDFVNAVARTYLEQNVERRSAEARSSLAFLEKQLPHLKYNVEEKEEELTAFRSSSGTISIPEETQGLLRQAIELENRRLELKLKQDELRQRFTPEHPTLKTTNRQLAAVEGASRELGAHIDLLPQSQRDLLRLERDSTVNTQLYISLLNTAQALRVSEAGTIGNVRIIDFAVLAERPVKPKRQLIVAVAGLLGLMLGIIAAFGRRFLRPAVQSAEQLEHRTGLTTYVSLPESETQKGFGIALPGRLRGGHRTAKMGQNVLALSKSDDPAIESLRSLRTGLSFALMGEKGKAIAIVGATAGVGKSFVSANLAAILAAGGQKVVVVDADLRRGRLHEYFGYQRAREGLSDVLLGQITLDQALVKVSDNFWVLPTGTLPPNPGELLLNGRLKAIMDQLEADHDRIIVDTAPLLPVADTLAVLQHMAATFMVVRAEYSTVGEVLDSVSKLRTAGLDEQLKGVIFNGVRRYRLGYGSSYKYKYYY